MPSKIALSILVALFVFGCQPNEVTEGEPDAGPRLDGSNDFDSGLFDAGVLDSGADAGTDAGTDAAAPDAGPIPVQVELIVRGEGALRVEYEGDESECSERCVIDAFVGDALTLTPYTTGIAEPAVWGGLCEDAAEGEACALLLSENGTITADFRPGLVDLELVLLGTGEVTVDNGGVLTTCAADCTISSVVGDTLSLTGAPLGHSLPVVWGELCAGIDSNTCALTVSAPGVVSAEFPAGAVDIDLTITGFGDVEIELDGVPQSCSGPGSCTLHGLERQVLSLRAVPRGRARAGVWSGLCAAVSGDTCSLTLSDPGAVGVDFPPGFVDIVVNVSLGGVVEIDHAGSTSTCASSCTVHGVERESLTLRAVPAAGHYLSGWTSLCAGASGDTCALTLADHATIQANFAVYTYDVVTSYSRESGAGGSVTYSPLGRACTSGDVCQNFDWGSDVTLTATADANSAFMGWTGACASATGNTCTLHVDQVHAAGARFERLRVVQIGTSGDGDATIAFGTSGTPCIPAAADCQRFVPGTPVVVDLTVDSVTSRLVSWTPSLAACSGTTSCTFSADDLSVDARVDLRRFDVTVPTPTGGGTISISASAPAESCPFTFGDPCYSYPYGTTVTITPQDEPAASAGTYQSRFANWNSTVCDSVSSAGVCTISSLHSHPIMNSAWTSNPRLTVGVVGTGSTSVLYERREAFTTATCQNTGGEGTEVACVYYPDVGREFTITATPAPLFMIDHFVSSTCYSGDTCIDSTSTPRTIAVVFYRLG